MAASGAGAIGLGLVVISIGAVGALVAFIRRRRSIVRARLVGCLNRISHQHESAIVGLVKFDRQLQNAEIKMNAILDDARRNARDPLEEIASSAKSLISRLRNICVSPQHAESAQVEVEKEIAALKTKAKLSR